MQQVARNRRLQPKFAFMINRLIFSLLVVFGMTGCLKNGVTDPCDYDPCASPAPASEIAAVQAYLTSNNITAVQHCSGLFYTIDAPGTGATPQTCSFVTVTYEGRLTNGTVFDATNQPVTFNLSEVIRGWRNGLPQLKSGGRIHLYVPPSLGYGGNANGVIPANSILIFRVDLLNVQ